MPIRLIPNQPIKLDAYKEPRFCQTGDDYCYLHQSGDPFRVQFRQIAFGISPGSCDPQFMELGPELVTNGDFNGSAAGWALASATYGSDKVCLNGAASAAVNQVLVLNPSSVYRYLVTISGLTTGSIYVSLGGATLGTIISDGDYVFYGVPGAFNYVEIGTIDASDACIDNVSLRLLFPCWEYDNDDFIVSYNASTSGQKITHVPGTATTFTAPDALISGGYYQCQIRVSGRTQGSVQMFAGDLDILSTPITQNGLFNQYLTGMATGASAGNPVDFFFIMDADFDGTIEYVFTYLLRTDFICTLVDVNGVPVADLTDKLVYNDDYVTLVFSGLNSILDLNGDPVEEGCYKISVTDVSGGGGGTLIIDGDFFEEDPTQTSWNEIGYFTNNITGGTANCISDGSATPISRIYQPSAPVLDDTKWYVASFRYKGNFVDPATVVDFAVGGFTAITKDDVTLNWQTAVSAPFQIVNSGIAPTLSVVLGDDTSGNTVNIDSVALYEVGDYFSNCINYKVSHPGTYTVIGRSNFKQSPESGPVYGFGFLFQPRNIYVFQLFQRLKLGFRKPTYPLVNQSGTYSTGRHYKSFSQTEKIFEVVFEPMGEIEHDAMAVMIQCPTFYIQNTDGISIGDAERFHCINDDYTPLYEEKDVSKNTRSIIKVQHIQDIVKISNT